MIQRSQKAEPTASTGQVVVAYIGFATLGLSVGLRGVAWPSIRVSFDLALGAIGVFLTAATAGSILASFNGGLIASKIGVGPLLGASSVVTALGLLGCTVAPDWWVMVLGGLMSGIGSGALHVGLNAHFTANHGAGVINWLHACFGIGATLGPLIMTAILQAGSSWRLGYGVASAVMALVAFAFVLTQSRWSGSGETVPQGSSDEGNARRGLNTLGLPVVWMSLLLFFLYTGAESTAGQWAYSLFAEGRSVPESRAGFWMSVYWGGLAAGRVLVGTVADRFDVSSLLRLCILSTVIGSVLIWWHPTDSISFLGLALMGIAQGPIFPSLVSDTPRRVDADHIDTTIGFQVAAASLGAAAISSLAGVLAEEVSLEILGPFLVMCTALMFILYEMVVRHTEGVEPSEGGP